MRVGLELARRGFHVTFVSVQETTEAADLGLRFVHPRLEQRRLAEFDPDVLAPRLRADTRCAVVAAPVREVIPKLERLRHHGFTTIYDSIDDWSDPALGDDWFSPDLERRLVGMANAVTASAPDLVERLVREYGADPVLVPNAVRADVFGGAPAEEPADFPAGTGMVIGYHGSLHGSWLDWPAIAAVAAAHPDARVVLIGDPPVPLPELPGNVHLLGLKAHGDIPAYVRRFDVGLVPFTVSPTTHAVSPLKVYEYLACGVPVAAPALRSLAGLAGVATAADLPDAVTAALAAGARPDRGPRHPLLGGAPRSEAVCRRRRSARRRGAGSRRVDAACRPLRQAGARAEGRDPRHQGVITPGTRESCH